MSTRRRGLLGRVVLLNLLIPLVLGTIREQIVGIWNHRLDMTLSELVVFSFRPMTTAAILVFSVIAYAIIAVMIRPLRGYLCDGSSHARARRAALRVPWILLILHVGGWFVGTFVLYALVFNWNSPGGISISRPLMISMSTGLATGSSPIRPRVRIRVRLL